MGIPHFQSEQLSGEHIQTSRKPWLTAGDSLSLSLYIYIYRSPFPKPSHAWSTATCRAGVHHWHLHNHGYWTRPRKNWSTVRRFTIFFYKEPLAEIATVGLFHPKNSGRNVIFFLDGRLDFQAVSGDRGEYHWGGRGGGWHTTHGTRWNILKYAHEHLSSSRTMLKNRTGVWTACRMIYAYNYVLNERSRSQRRNPLLHCHMLRNDLTTGMKTVVWLSQLVQHFLHQLHDLSKTAQLASWNCSPFSLNLEASLQGDMWGEERFQSQRGVGLQILPFHIARNWLKSFFITTLSNASPYGIIPLLHPYISMGTGYMRVLM